jgi:hypothetical protein
MKGITNNYEIKEESTEYINCDEENKLVEGKLKDKEHEN